MTILDMISKILMPVALILVMLGMGLTLKISDFKRVITFPKAGFLGIAGQIILLPIMALIFISLIPMPPEIAIGMTVFPVGLGMIIGAKKPALAVRYEPFFRKAGTILIILFIIFAVWGEIDFVLENLASVAPLALFFNLVMMTIGFFLAHLFSLELLQKITITVEIGVQNNILAFLVALTILNNKQYMTFAAFYGILMLFTAFGFVTYMRKTKIEKQ